MVVTVCDTEITNVSHNRTAVDLHELTGTLPVFVLVAQREKPVLEIPYASIQNNFLVHGRRHERLELQIAQFIADVDTHIECHILGCYRHCGKLHIVRCGICAVIHLETHGINRGGQCATPVLRQSDISGCRRKIHCVYRQRHSRQCGKRKHFHTVSIAT